MKRSPKSAEGRQLANETVCDCPPCASEAFLRGGEKLVLDGQQHRYRWEDGERVKELNREGRDVWSWLAWLIWPCSTDKFHVTVPRSDLAARVP